MLTPWCIYTLEHIIIMIISVFVLDDDQGRTNHNVGGFKLTGEAPITLLCCYILTITKLNTNCITRHCQIKWFVLPCTWEILHKSCIYRIKSESTKDTAICIDAGRALNSSETHGVMSFWLMNKLIKHCYLSGCLMPNNICFISIYWIFDWLANNWLCSQMKYNIWLKIVKYFW